eukprot:1110048-Rhodomonas_salina.1
MIPSFVQSPLSVPVPPCFLMEHCSGSAADTMSWIIGWAYSLRSQVDYWAAEWLGNAGRSRTEKQLLGKKPPPLPGNASCQCSSASQTNSP